MLPQTHTTSDSQLEIYCILCMKQVWQFQDLVAFDLRSYSMRKETKFVQSFRYVHYYPICITFSFLICFLTVLSLFYFMAFGVQFLVFNFGGLFMIKISFFFEILCIMIFLKPRQLGINDKISSVQIGCFQDGISFVDFVRCLPMLPFCRM